MNKNAQMSEKTTLKEPSSRYSLEHIRIFSITGESFPPANVKNTNAAPSVPEDTPSPSITLENKV